MVARRSSRMREKAADDVSAVHHLVTQTFGLQDEHIQKVFTDLTEADIKEYLTATPLRDEKSGNGDSISVWDFIQQKGSGWSRAEAIQEVLASRTNAIECYGVEMGALLIYALRQKVWEDHPDPDLRSPQSWLQSIRQAKTLERAVLSGAQSLIEKDEFLIDIVDAWGPDWYKEPRQDLRPASAVPWRLPSQDLRYLAVYASKNRISMPEVNRKLAAAVEARKKRKRRNDFDDHLISQDFVALANSVTPKRTYKKRRNGTYLSAQHKLGDDDMAASQTSQGSPDKATSTGLRHRISALHNIDATTTEHAIGTVETARNEARNSDDGITLRPTEHAHYQEEVSYNETDVQHIRECVQRILNNLKMIKKLSRSNHASSISSHCLDAIAIGRLPSCIEELCRAALGGSTQKYDLYEGVAGACSDAVHTGSSSASDRQDAGSETGAQPNSSACIDHLIFDDAEDYGENHFATLDIAELMRDGEEPI